MSKEDGLVALLRLAGLEEGFREARAYEGPLTDCVYYWLRGDLVKIGHSRCLSRRIKVLQPGVLLAIEPGERNIEQGRHIQFADYRDQETDWGTEWFRPGPLLVWHIEAMAKLYPVDLLTELPQLRVPMRQRSGRPLQPVDLDAQERLALWVDMLPRIIAEGQAAQHLTTPTPEGVSA